MERVERKSPYALSNHAVYVRRAKGLLLLCLLMTGWGCAAQEYRFERLDGEDGIPVPLELVAFEGLRDGAAVQVEALFNHENDSAKMNLLLHLTPAAECKSAHYQLTFDGQTTEGPVECSSLSFLGGQNAQPSVGGVFLLKDRENRPAYRVTIPTRVLSRRR